MSGRAGIVEYGIDNFNDYCRALVQRTTDAWERYVTRQARWVDFANDYKTMDLSYMESVHVGVQGACGRRGCSTKASGSSPTAGSARPRSRTSRPARTTPTGPARTPPSRSLFTLDPDDDAGRPRRDLRAAAGHGVDHDTVDPAVEPGPRRRPRHRVRRVRAPGRAHGDRRRRVPPPTPSSSATPSPWRTLPGLGAGRAHLPAALPVLRRPRPAPSGCSAADFVATDEGTGVVHLAPGFGEEDFDVCQAAGIAVVCPVDDRARFTSEVPPYAGQLVFDANRRHHRRSEGRRGARRGQVLHPQLPPLLAHRHAAHLQGGGLVVREGDRRQGPHDRAQPARSTGSRRTSATAPSGSGSKGPATGRSAGTGSGDHPSRCGRATTRATRASTSTAASTSSSATSASASTDLHRPAIDELVRPNPDDPTGALDDAPGHRRARLLVRVRVDALRPGPLPLRASRVVRVALPRRLHRRVRGPDPGLVLHPARARHRPVRPPAVPTLRRPRHRARRRRAQDVQAPGQLPRARHGLRHVGGRRHALVPALRRRSCGARTSWCTPRASKRCGARS